MRAVPLALLVLALAACGGGQDGGAAPPAGTPAPGGGLSVSEAIASELDGPLMVRGYVLERDGELRLCEAILESSPPQCGEPSLRVEGAAPPPSEERRSLLGEVRDGAIVVSETSIG